MPHSRGFEGRRYNEDDNGGVGLDGGCSKDEQVWRRCDEALSARGEGSTAGGESVGCSSESHGGRWKRWLQAAMEGNTRAGDQGGAWTKMEKKKGRPLSIRVHSFIHTTKKKVQQNITCPLNVKYITCPLNVKYSPHVSKYYFVKLALLTINEY